MEKSTLLIVEDNPETRRFLQAMLSKDFNILTAENAIIGMEIARNQNPDLILLDVMLPILSGYDACSLMKKDERTRHIPIIFLSAKNTVSDITQGLTGGADDYIPKPFDYKELVARIRARLRRAPDAAAQAILVGSLKIDPASREAVYSGKTTNLTLTEFDILRCLASRAGHVVSRDEILKEVWKDTAGNTSDRTIDVHVRALRKKIPAMTRHIVSIYGVGYKYEK